MAAVLSTGTWRTALIVSVLIVLADQAMATTVCPQRLANDPSPVFCATNSYGSVNVRRSEFENWNCNHPLNKYTQTSQVACTPVATPITCTPATCDNTGPTVCARLPSPVQANAFTSAVFGNQCQLTLYNCRNPSQRYTLAPSQTAPCTSSR